MSILSTLIKPLAYVSLPVYVLSKVASSTPFGRYYIRLSLYLSTLSICSIWGVVCAVGMSVVGQRFNVNYVVARSFYFLASRIIDIKVEVVEGEEYLDTRPSVLVANHQSMVDILLLGRVFPKRASIMGKRELQWSPLLGQYMALSGAVFVDRGNNAKAIQSLTAAGETIKSRTTSLWMFPEGTRSMRPHNDLLSFKKGAFHTAVNAGVPIVPVVFENYWKLYHKGVFESGVIKVKVLPPVPTEGLKASDVSNLSTRVRDSMLQALQEISTSSSPSPSTTNLQPKSSSSSTHHSSSPRIQTPSSSSTIPTSISIPPSPSHSTSTPPPLSLGNDTGVATTADSIVVVPGGNGGGSSTNGSGTRSRSESRASTSYTSSEVPSSPAISLSGVETEEDEGMVLVGRPNES